MTGPVREETKAIGLHSEVKEEEDYPFRLPTKPVVIAKPGNYVEIREITDLLEKTRPFGPKKLGMCFRGNVHKISQHDLDVIEGLMRERA